MYQEWFIYNWKTITECYTKYYIVLYQIFKGAIKFVIAWNLFLQIPVQSVPITTNIVNLNPDHDEVYSKQHYVIKFVSNLPQVGGFLRLLRFPPPIKLTATM